MESSPSLKPANFSVPVIWFVACAISLTAAFFGYLLFTGQQRTKSFLPTNAVVTESKTTFHYLRRNSYYDTSISFQYQGSDGRAHSQSMKLTADYLHPEWGNSADWDRGYWASGHSFTVYCNPSNYDDWSLDRGPSRQAYALLFGGGLVGIISAFMFYITLINLFNSDPGPAYLPSDSPELARQRNYETYGDNTWLD